MYNVSSSCSEVKGHKFTKKRLLILEDLTETNANNSKANYNIIRCLNTQNVVCS